MVNLGKREGEGGIGKQLGNLFIETSAEAMREVGDLGKRVVKGVTKLPIDLVKGALFGEKARSWDSEWLGSNPIEKNISSIEGGHTSINPAELMKKFDKAKQKDVLADLGIASGSSEIKKGSGINEKVARQKMKKTTASALRAQFTASPINDNQQNQAVYDKRFSEVVEKGKQNNKNDYGLGSMLVPHSKQARGSAFAPRKRKSASVRVLERKPSKGK